jgi:hypothetical protein
MARELVSAFLVAALLLLPLASGADPSSVTGSASDACTLQAGGGPSPVPCRLHHAVTVTAGPCTFSFCTYTVESRVLADADAAGLLAVRVTVDDGSTPPIGACVGPEGVTDPLDRVSPVQCGQDCSDSAFGTTLECASTRTHAADVAAGECALILVHATLLYDEVVAMAGTYVPFQLCR